MNEDRPVLSATELQPTKCTFQRCTDCVDISSHSSARGHQTMLRLQKQVFVHTRLLRAYLALARLSCKSSILLGSKRFCHQNAIFPHDSFSSKLFQGHKLLLDPLFLLPDLPSRYYSFPVSLPSLHPETIGFVVCNRKRHQYNIQLRTTNLGKWRLASSHFNDSATQRPDIRLKHAATDCYNVISTQISSLLPGIQIFDCYKGQNCSHHVPWTKNYS